MKFLLVLVSLISFLVMGCDALSGSSTAKSATDNNQQDNNQSLNYTSPNIGTLVYVPLGSFQRDSTATNISVITTPFRLSEKEVTIS